MFGPSHRATSDSTGPTVHHTSRADRQVLNVSDGPHAATGRVGAICNPKYGARGRRRLRAIAFSRMLVYLTFHTCRGTDGNPRSRRGIGFSSRTALR